MKHIEVKKVWVDDDNHFLKGYPINEIAEVEDKEHWYQAWWKWISSLFRK